MKKVLSVIALLCCLPFMVGCHLPLMAFLFLGMGTTYEKNAENYGKEDEYVRKSMFFFPKTLEGYDTVSYSYTLYSYMDTCYEVYLELNARESQLESIVKEGKANENFIFERQAYYADGYYEIVFSDEYEPYENKDGEEKNVGFATVDKIIYNPETGNVIFESFHAHDTGVYALKDVIYFQRFAINETEYVENLGENNGKVL